jgi:hypothetical protein
VNHQGISSKAGMGKGRVEVVVGSKNEELFSRLSHLLFNLNEIKTKWPRCPSGYLDLSQVFETHLIHCTERIVNGFLASPIFFFLPIKGWHGSNDEEGRDDEDQHGGNCDEDQAAEEDGEAIADGCI